MFHLPGSLSVPVLLGWWQAWWFRLTALAALAYLGRGLCRWRSARSIREQRRLEQLAEEQTQELRAEKSRVVEEKEKYRLLFEKNPHPVWVYDTKTLAFLAVNEAAVRHYGYSREEFSSLTILDLRPPEDRATVSDLVSQANGALHPAGVWRHRKKSGELIDVEITVHSLCFDGREVRLMLANDITERRRAEEALRESEERFRALFEQAPVAYHEIDKQGIVQRVNRAESALLGFEPEEMLGKPIWEFVAPDQQEGSRAAIARKMSGKQQLASFHREYLRRDRQRLILEIHERFIRDNSGEIVGIRTAMLDVTERRRAEEELRKAKEAAEAANAAKSVFLANMSHEIRTPMHGILGMMSLALTSDLTGEQREYLETAKGSAESLLVLLNEILDFSKIEAGKLELEPVAFSLRECLRGAVQILAPRARQKGLELSCEMDSRIPPALVGDPIRLRQVVLNLIGNAIKFTTDGAIRLRAGVESQHSAAIALHFSVADTGIGIPPEKQGVIFEAFRQADGSTTRQFGGTGLGLAICSKLVGLMGGRCWVESAVGCGSTFHFTASFGLAPELEEAAASLRPPAPIVEVPGASPGRRLSILVVEDNPVNQKIAVRMLEKMDHRVEVARNGREALEALDPRSFDLILMDVQMPEMDGIETTAAIRARERFTGAHVPILALTAHSMKGDRERFLDAGMDGYLAKPFRGPELEAAVRALTSTSPFQPLYESSHPNSGR